MDSNLTHIYILLDRSGSMRTLREGAVEGINSLVRSQAEVEGQRCLVTIVQFDAPSSGADWYKKTHSLVDCRDFKPLTQWDFVPRGWTALNRAGCMMIDEIGYSLARLPEHQRPGKVIVTMVTDGEENFSGPEFPDSRLREKVVHQTQKYAWEFQYVGTNQDSIAVGANYGISVANCANYSPTSCGIKSAFGEIGVSMAAYRKGETRSASFNGPSIGIES